MFIGYEVKSNQNQAKSMVLETDIKLSQVVLDPSSVKNKKEPVSVVAEYNKKQFILAVLEPGQWQSPLDLVFAAGSQLKLFVRGSGTVHITGFEQPDDLDDIEMSMSESDVEDTSDEEAEKDSSKKSGKDKVGSAKKISVTNGHKSGATKANGKDSGKAVHPSIGKPSGDEDDSDSDDDSFCFDDSDDDSADIDEDEEMDEDDDDLGELDEDDDDDDDDDE